MENLELHPWVRRRLAAWRAGLLADDESGRVAAHLESCEDCRRLAEAFRAPAEPEPGAHVPPSLIAEWPRARRALRGLERSLVRRHLERCGECRQDLELLGHEPRLERIPELESETALAGASPSRPIGATDHGEAAPGSAPAVAGAPSEAGPADATRQTVIRIVRPHPRPRWWDRALVGWSAVATAAAVVTIVVHLRRPFVEGVPLPVVALSPPPIVVPSATSAREPAPGPTLRIVPRPRSLSGPTRGPRRGKVTVIPVVGPVHSLALAVRPLDVPDTSLVMVRLLDGAGDTLLSGPHRQWEFFPKRVLMIDAGKSPFQPGQYLLELSSPIHEDGESTSLESRYRFELRPKR